ncbi:MAG: ribonuclease E/G [Pseudomonadota bacterium]
MSKQMLIDAVHPEETRVALVNDGRIEDFDFETAGKEQLRGNIYLAKVTRVEPSLQACFVEYGGNRHGFLAFSEIHPDYYQLPQADRDALLEEAARAAEEAGDDHDDDDFDAPDEDDIPSAELDESEEADLEAAADTDADDAGETGTTDEADDIAEADPDAPDIVASDEANDAASDEPSDDSDDDEEASDSEAKPEARRRSARKTRATSLARRYKIQEVIRRRQILLVQVVKEERGNKGAALTTYLSLAGRYSVLMPNTPRGGGISRKIANTGDRRRLKAIMGQLDVPKGMGLIVRTAGAKRTESDIRRDYDYLQSLWNNIRSATMESIAPACIHEEGGLVHRAMRDMFDRGIEDVIVQGDKAYREAKDLAKVLMPTQARKVKRWTAPQPLFSAESVEDQLDSIFSPVVQMKSGGYLVINQTEALVAIDVNSGKSTRERSIEQTALRTNLEAADEACRQMRLRDLAGLVVIDFIDMDENKNNRAVEKRMKEALKLDRARVQNSRISQFGLMEISRQRRRAGILQATSEVCDACNGTGSRRSIPSAALQLIRALESRAAGDTLKGITVTAPTDVALYLLNAKRDAISSIEDAAGFTIAISSSVEMIPGDFELKVDKEGGRRRRKAKFDRSKFLEGDEDDHLLPEPEDDEGEETALADGETSQAPVEGEDESGENSASGRKRRRRGRRGGRRRRREGDLIDPGTPPSDGGALLDGISASVTNLLDDEPPALPAAEDGGLISSPVAVLAQASAPVEQKTETAEAGSDEGAPKKKRRRRRRRRRSEGDETQTVEATESNDETASEPEKVSGADPVAEAPESDGEPVVIETVESEAPAPAPEPVAAEAAVEPEPEAAPEPDVTPEPAVAAEPAPTPSVSQPIATEPVLETSAPAAKKKRRGWWSKG